MTILEAINRVDTTKPNSYTQIEKVDWLSTLDGIIKNEIINTHEGGEAIVFEGYTPDTNLDTELLVPAPYDEIYIRWLEARIDYANGEYKKYNNSTMAYNTAFEKYSSYYNRINMPIGKKFKFF
jgi:hypothetical protein